MIPEILYHTHHPYTIFNPLKVHGILTNLNV